MPLYYVHYIVNNFKPPWCQLNCGGIF